MFWSGFEAAASATLSFASAFIVARLVGPSEVGIGAAVVAVHVLLWVAVNALFADALVQRAPWTTQRFPARSGLDRDRLRRGVAAGWRWRSRSPGRSATTG